MNNIQNFLSQFLEAAKRPNKYINSAHKFNKTNLNQILSGHTTKENYNTEITKSEVINLEDDLKNICERTEYKINELMGKLADVIKYSCDKYRKSLTTQIEILNYGLHLEDKKYKNELMKNKLEAKKLKQEIKKYKSLLEYIEEVIYNFSICGAILETIDPKYNTCDSFHILQKLITQENNLNKCCEAVLHKLEKKYIIKL